ARCWSSCTAAETMARARGGEHPEGDRAPARRRAHLARGVGDVPDEAALARPHGAPEPRPSGTHGAADGAQRAAACASVRSLKAGPGPRAATDTQASAAAPALGTAAPLTRDFVTIGMASAWADTSRMK